MSDKSYEIKFTLKRITFPIVPMLEISAVFGIATLIISFIIQNFGLLFIGGFFVGIFFGLFFVTDETGKKLWEREIYEIKENLDDEGLVDNKGFALLLLIILVIFASIMLFFAIYAYLYGVPVLFNNCPQYFERMANNTCILNTSEWRFI